MTTLAHLGRMAVLTLLLVQGAPAIARQGDPLDGTEIRSSISQRIDGFIQERMASSGVPGVSVAVVRDGQIAHLAGYGVADPAGRAATPDTPFLIGSVSKPMTATAVLQLVRDGSLGLEDPVAPYLGAIIGHEPPAFQGVTVGQLLTHTSGLSMSLGLPGTEAPQSGSGALDRRVADLVAHHRPVASPGERYEYSNANYMLLASIVEQVSGRDFADYMREQVFGPLGMDATFATDSDPVAAQLATGHQRWFGTWWPADLPYDPAAAAMGYMGSTARDLATFLQAHLRTDPPAALPDPLPEVVGRSVIQTGWDVPLESAASGGWFVDELGGHTVVSHSGSLGDFTAHLILVPGADGLGLAVQTNASAFVAAGHAGQYEVSLGLLHLLLGLESNPSSETPLTTLVAPVLVWVLFLAVAVLAGRYLLAVRSGQQRYRRSNQMQDPIDGHFGPPRSEVSPGGLRRWLRALIPGCGFLALSAVALLVVPVFSGASLETTRIFYPDVGWGVTMLGAVALGWGVVRTVMGVLSLRSTPVQGGHFRALQRTDGLGGTPWA